MSPTPPTRLEVDLQAYSRNLAAVRARIPKSCGVMAVVKANAYGLGAVPVAQRALQEGAAMLGVATVDEGVELREAGIDGEILVLVQPSEEALGAALRHRLKLMMSSVPMAERLGDLARKAKVVATIHCEIDTGMGRLGMNLETAAAALLDLRRISNVDIEGIATHFPSADLENDPFTLNQIRTFRQLLKQLDKAGIPYEMAHTANSAAIVNYLNSAFDLVRAGLMTFGVWPTDTRPEGEGLAHVVRWTSRVVLVKELPGGASVSYGRTYKAPRPMRAATIPVGYADGYPHRLSNCGEVLIRGQRCPIRGSVCMDCMVADVTGVDGVSVGDEVTLLGEDGGERITPEELARAAQTIPYEILTRIGTRLERVYIN